MLIYILKNVFILKILLLRYLHSGRLVIKKKEKKTMSTKPETTTPASGEDDSE